MEFTADEILQLVKKKMREQGAYDRDAYRQFIDETIQYFLEKGKLTDDDDLELIESKLMSMWDSVKNKIGDEDDEF
jgi:hypothetical protein